MALDILFVQYAYGGNGGVASTLPEIVEWWADTKIKMHLDPRIGRIETCIIADTPITMGRNKAVQEARRRNCDLILMIDSDNKPDTRVGGDHEAKPFWDSSFEFVYDRKVKGLPTGIAAPYCGPPPNELGSGEENPYAFYWTNNQTESPDDIFRIAQYERMHAAMMKGIHPVAAVPTGLTLWTTDCFDLPELYDTRRVIDELMSGKLDKAGALQKLKRQGYFYYEYEDVFCESKASTEDVTASRDISLAGHAKGYGDCLWMNFDSWAGHMKPKCVGKPQRIAADYVAAELGQAAVGPAQDDETRYVDFTQNEPAGNSFPANGKAPVGAKDKPLVGKPTAGKHTYTESHKGTTDVSKIAMSSTEDLVVLRTIVQQLAVDRETPMDVVEVGSWNGESAKAMVQTGLCNVLCIDPLYDRCVDPNGNVVYDAPHNGLFDAFINNTAKYPEITLLRAPSLEAAKGFHPRQRPDIVFIDGDHDEESVRGDIEAWLPIVKDDGYLIGHDYGHPAFEGVQRAVDSTLGHVMTFNRGYWVYSKKDANPQVDKTPMEDVVSNTDYVGGVHSTICGRKVRQLGIETPEQDLKALKEWTRYLQGMRPYPVKVVEVGSWVGASTLALLEGMLDGGGCVHCVDHWLGSPDQTADVINRLENGGEDVFERFKENIGKDFLGTRVMVTKGDACEVAMKFKQSLEVDMVYLDADHRTDEVIRQVLAWLPHIRDDGFMTGHDYTTPEVKKAVHKVFPQDLVQIIDETAVWVVSVGEYRKWLAEHNENRAAEEAVTA